MQRIARQMLRRPSSAASTAAQSRLGTGGRRTTASNLAIGNQSASIILPASGSASSSRLTSIAEPTRRSSRRLQTHATTDEGALPSHAADLSSPRSIASFASTVGSAMRFLSNTSGDEATDVTEVKPPTLRTGQDSRPPRSAAGASRGPLARRGVSADASDRPQARRSITAGAPTATASLAQRKPRSSSVASTVTTASGRSLQGGARRGGITVLNFQASSSESAGAKPRVIRPDRPQVSFEADALPAISDPFVVQYTTSERNRISDQAARLQQRYKRKTLDAAEVGDPLLRWAYKRVDLNINPNEGTSDAQPEPFRATSAGPSARRRSPRRGTSRRRNRRNSASGSGTSGSGSGSGSGTDGSSADERESPRPKSKGKKQGAPPAATGISSNAAALVPYGTVHPLSERLQATVETEHQQAVATRRAIARAQRAEHRRNKSRSQGGTMTIGRRRTSLLKLVQTDSTATMTPRHGDSTTSIQRYAQRPIAPNASRASLTARRPHLKRPGFPIEGSSHDTEAGGSDESASEDESPSSSPTASRHSDYDADLDGTPDGTYALTSEPAVLNPVRGVAAAPLPTSVRVVDMTRDQSTECRTTCQRLMPMTIDSSASQ